MTSLILFFTYWRVSDPNSLNDIHSLLLSDESQLEQEHNHHTWFPYQFFPDYFVSNKVFLYSSVEWPGGSNAFHSDHVPVFVGFICKRWSWRLWCNGSSSRGEWSEERRGWGSGLPELGSKELRGHGLIWFSEITNRPASMPPRRNSVLLLSIDNFFAFCLM